MEPSAARRFEMDPVRLLWMTFLAMLGIGALTRGLLLYVTRGSLAGADTFELARALWVGMRLDAVVAAYLCVPLLVPLAWPGRRVSGVWGRLVVGYAASAWAIVVLGAAGDVAFFRFYGYRMNFLVLDHAGEPEVLSAALRMPYVLESLGAAALVLGVGLACRPVLGRRIRATSRSLGRDLLQRAATVVIVVLCARGTLDHRPLNPSLASIGSIRALNELVGSGLFSVSYEATRRARGEAVALASVVGELPDREARERTARLIRSIPAASAAAVRYEA